MTILSKNQIRILIIIAACLFFVPYLGIVHLFDWDEINFAEAAREMIVSGDYLTVQINFQPFWEKPPLFIYFQVLAMKLFGINEFSARLPNAICGVFTLVSLFNIGSKLKNKTFGVFWVLAYAGSVLPFFYFKSGIIDPWFNLFIFLGLYYLVRYFDEDMQRKNMNIIAAASFAGLAIMTKGPVGLIIILLTTVIYLISIKFKVKIKVKDILLYVAVLIVVGGFWFLIQLVTGNYEIIVDFIQYQIRLLSTEDASHGGFFGYHFVVLLFGVFPSSVLALSAFQKRGQAFNTFELLRRFMVILFWVVLVLFTIVKTKIIHYSSLAYFPITFLAAYFVYNLKDNQFKWQRWHSVLTTLLSIIISIPVLLIPFVDQLKSFVIEKDWIKDDFAVANLSANGNWSGFEFLIGVFFLIAISCILLLIPDGRAWYRAIALWITTLIFTFNVLLFIVPKIEKYTQGALIQFIEEIPEDAVVKTLHFKSYAPLFYGQVKPDATSTRSTVSTLLQEDADNDLYFITKIQHANLEESFPELTRIASKNGFVLYLKKK